MKKRISILLALVLAFTLLMTACGEKASTGGKKDNNKVENNDADTNDDANADDDADTNDDANADDDAATDDDDAAEMPSRDYAKLDERKGAKVRAGDANMIIRMDSADDLPFDGGWTVRHYPLEGGVYVDGDLMTHIPFVKVKEDQYLFFWQNYGVSIVEGTEVVLDGIIGTEAYGVKIGPTTLTFDGTNWVGEGVEFDPAN